MQPELVRMVAERTGIPEDKARSAAETVLGYLKDKVPEPLARQLDGIVGGDSGQGSTSGLGSMASNIGSKLGGRG